MQFKASKIILPFLVNVARMLLAFTFIFSGFVKVNDPMGMLYKTEAYFAAWNVHVPNELLLGAVIALGVVEFSVGTCLFFGISKKAITKLTLIIMAVMTVLTLYILIANPVDDCGCFGDALIISNTATFLKNVVLLAAALLAVWKSDKIVEFLSPNTAWILSLFSIVYAAAVACLSLYSLPLVDFMPFKVGASIRDGVNVPDSLMPKYESVAIYRKGNDTINIDINDDEPGDGWKYVGIDRKVVKEGKLPEITNFYVVSPVTGDDAAADILDYEGYTFLLVCPQLMYADEGNTGRINEIYDYSLKYGYPFYCIAAADTTQINHWIDHTGAEYDVWIGDEQTLKSMVRSNPGLLLVKDGVVVEKWGNNILPDETQLDKPLEEALKSVETRPSNRKAVVLAVAFFFVPALLLLLLDKLASRWAYYRMMKRKSKKMGIDNVFK